MVHILEQRPAGHCDSDLSVEWYLSPFSGMVLRMLTGTFVLKPHRRWPLCPWHPWIPKASYLPYAALGKRKLLYWQNWDAISVSGPQEMSTLNE